MEMLKSQKSQLTCSYCSRIFRDPILLPCGDSICRDHLKDRDVVKANRIKCKKCNEEFGVTQELILTKSYARSYNFLLENLNKNRRFLIRKEQDLTWKFESDLIRS